MCHMSKNPAQAEADRLFEEALERSGARDPREYYRDRLRELKSSNPEAYEEAVSFYRDRLIPEVASGGSDPLQAWLRYGRMLASLTVEGEAVEVDGSGRRHPLSGDASHDNLVLHIPSGRGGRALLVGLPKDPTPAQRATYELLVLGRLKMRRS